MELSVDKNGADHKNTLTFAMKVMSKAMIYEKNYTKYALTERNILATCTENPFLVKLYFAFQNSKNAFLMLEYCPCGDLGKVLERERRLSEEVARIYIAEILLALEYLHSQRVLYRDLKPDNVLISKTGHLKLADFGLSKMGVDESYSSTSFLGTPAYLPPEIVTHIPYGKSADWYCLGAVLYEFCVGSPPYYSKNIDGMYENIADGALKLPREMSNDLKDLLKGLLKRNMVERLGANGAQEIKDHPFFASIDWTTFDRQLPSG